MPVRNESVISPEKDIGPHVTSTAVTLGNSATLKVGMIEIELEVIYFGNLLAVEALEVEDVAVNLPQLIFLEPCFCPKSIHVASLYKVAVLFESSANIFEVVIAKVRLSLLIHLIPAPVDVPEFSRMVLEVLGVDDIPVLQVFVIAD